MTVASEAQPGSQPPAAERPPVSIVVEAVYEDGVIKPLTPLDLQEGTPISLQIVTRVTAVATPYVDGNHQISTDQTMPAAPVAHPHPAERHSRLQRGGDFLRAGVASDGILAALARLDLALLAFGIVVYALTRFIGLTRFPIYFFCDEAIQTTQAESLLLNGFRDGAGTLLPPYFLNADKWNLSLSVYLQLISLALFGKSVFVTRATSVVVTILGAAAVALTLKLIFNNRLWWTGTLVMAVIPAWFLHSRTAFETVMMVSFYACFLCTYLLYRYRSPRYLFPAMLFGAATFYSYANGQGVMLVSGVLLLLSDLRYHLRQPRKMLLGALLLAALLALPYVRFRFLHPEAMADQLRSLDSYWLKGIPLGEKLATFGRTYLLALSPGYWFFPNQIDLDRHQMKGMGHLSPLALPFILVGLVVCLRNWRSSAHRAMLIAVLAAPFSGSLVAILIPRVLAMVVPAALLICIGLDQIASWLRKWVPHGPLAIGAGALLCLLSFSMVRAVLVDGPTWYTNYGLYGMQYGGEQVFGAIREELTAAPGTRIALSPNWSNNTGVFPAFFLPDAQREPVALLSVDSFLLRKRDLDPNQLFILPPDEYERALASGKFVMQPPERILPYPDGNPGFYFVRMRYADNVDAIFAAERVARQQLKESVVTIDGQEVLIRHSELDMGRVEDLFDNDPATLIRGLEANPLVLEFDFPTPRTVSGLKMHTAMMNLSLKVELTPANGGPTSSSTATYRDSPDEPRIDYTFPGGPQQVSRLRIEITDITPSEEVHIHVRDLSFL